VEEIGRWDSRSDAESVLVYDSTYKEVPLMTIREFPAAAAKPAIDGPLNGMHKYNNQDHSMLTAMLAVKMCRRNHDLWNAVTWRRITMNQSPETSNLDGA